MKTSTPIRSNMVPHSTSSLSTIDSSVVELLETSRDGEPRDGNEIGALENEVLELPTVQEESEKDDTSVVEVVDEEDEKPEDALLSDTSF